MVCKDKNNNLYITCDCGCDNIITIRKFDDEVFISLSSSKFYTEQNVIYNKIFDILKELLIIQKHKKNILAECILNNKEDILAIKKYLEEIVNDLSEENSYKNTSSLIIESISDDDFNFKNYAVEILGTSKNLSDILFHRHRRYEIVATKNDVKKLIKYCDKALK